MRSVLYHDQSIDWTNWRRQLWPLGHVPHSTSGNLIFFQLTLELHKVWQRLLCRCLSK